MRMRKKISMLLLTTFMGAQSVYAKGETPVGDGLSYVIDAFTGATGIALATLSVMIVGLLCLSHFLKWSAIGYTIVGIAFIFGASSIVQGIISHIH